MNRLSNALLEAIKIVAILIMYKILSSRFKRQREEREKTRQKLRYFNPVLKKDFWGDEYIEWQGRTEPLTDEQLDKLTNGKS